MQSHGPSEMFTLRNKKPVRLSLEIVVFMYLCHTIVSHDRNVSMFGVGTNSFEVETNYITCQISTDSVTIYNLYFFKLLDAILVFYSSDGCGSLNLQ